MDQLFIVELVIFSVALFVIPMYCIYRNETFISSMVQSIIITSMSIISILTVDEVVKNPIYALTIVATIILINLIILIIVMLLRVRAFYWARDMANKKAEKYYKRYGKKKFSKFVAAVRKIEYGPRLKYGTPAMAEKNQVIEVNINGEKKKIKTKFDKKGFPIFSTVIFEMQLKPKDYKASREVHFNRASKAFFEKAMKDKRFMNKMMNTYKMTKKDFSVFQSGKVPSKFTWHHHQDKGRMQLVYYSVHSKVNHVGGFSIWGKKKNS